MAKKKKKAPAAKRKKLTSERPLKNRPVDNDEPTPPENEENEAGGEEGDEESLVTVETPRKRGRQRRLPTMEDAAIEELEKLAEDYRAALDERMEALKEEVDLKDKLLDAMKRHGKEKYFHAGVSIEVVNSKDKIRVRINKDGD